MTIDHQEQSEVCKINIKSLKRNPLEAELNKTNINTGTFNEIINKQIN